MPVKSRATWAQLRPGDAPANPCRLVGPGASPPASVRSAVRPWRARALSPVLPRQQSPSHIPCCGRLRGRSFICRPAKWSDHWTTSRTDARESRKFDQRLTKPISDVRGYLSTSTPTRKAAGPICALAEIGPTTEAISWKSASAARFSRNPIPERLFVNLRQRNRPQKIGLVAGAIRGTTKS